MSAMPENVTGVLNLDKPAGLTSHQVVAEVRRLAGQRRVGHAGTLDPMATGVLVVCLGKATRLVEYLSILPKVYRAVINFGITTDTGDAEGTVVAERDASNLSLEAIEALLPRFTGWIEQIPPMYSALKHEGQPLYRLARQGLVVQRAPRSVLIEDMEILSWAPPSLTLQLRCSPGTYVRSLAHDLGEAAGTGAHLSALRRLAVGHFRIENSVSLEDLAEDGVGHHLIAPANALAHMPQITVSDEMAALILHGQDIRIDIEEDGPCLAIDSRGELLATLRPEGREPGRWHPEKVFFRPD